MDKPLSFHAFELRVDVAPDERLFAVTRHFLAHEMERG